MKNGGGAPTPCMVFDLLRHFTNNNINSVLDAAISPKGIGKKNGRKRNVT